MTTYEYERTWFDVTTHRSPKLQRLVWTWRIL